jgi:hypothetical protein
VEIVLKDSAKNNTISILGSILEDNSVTLDGGALRIAIEFYDCTYCVTENTLFINNTQFLSNSATWGGAVELFSSQEKTLSTNSISFYNCTWNSNVAHESAAAVDVALDVFGNHYPGFLPVPLFENCTFVNNVLRSTQTGILSVQSYEVRFKSYVRFEGNLGTALYLTDATAVLLNNTIAEFINNSATNGGAISLMGFSTIQIHPETRLSFINNKALELGGAVYYYSTNPALFYSYTCFIEYFDVTLKPGNWSKVKIFLKNNTALGYGQAIYGSTLLPCAKVYGEGNTTEEKLQTLFIQPPFYYQDPYTRGLLGTAPYKLNFDDEVLLSASPGQVFQTGISAFDELGQLVDAVIHAAVTKGSKYAAIAPTYSYTINGMMKLTGMPGTSVELSLQTTGPIQAKTSMEIVLSECPPGFYR